MSLLEFDGGTKLVYTVTLTPRKLGGVVGPVAGLLIKRRINAGLDALQRGLVGGITEMDPPKPLTDAQTKHLRAGLSGIDPAIARALIRRVTNAPRLVQDRMRPFQIAAEDNLDPTQVAAACLRAAERGVLTLRWEVLCPRCRGAKAEMDVLSLSTKPVHCRSCDVRYDAILAENIEVVFRPHDTLRPGRPAVNCALSPSRTPHIKSRLDLPGLQDRTWTNRLKPGCYLIEAGKRRALIEVAEGHDDGPVVFAVRAGGISPSVVRVAPGVVSFVMRNRMKRGGEVILASRWRPAYALTAGALLGNAVLRQALPVAALGDNQSQMFDGFAMALHGADDTLDALSDGALHKTYRLRSNLLLVSLHNVNDCFDITEQLAASHLPISVGLSSGLVLELSDGAQTTVCGVAPEQAIDVVRRVVPPQMGAPHTTAVTLEGKAKRRSARFFHRQGLPSLLAHSATIDGLNPTPSVAPSSVPITAASSSVPKKPKPLPGPIAGMDVVSRLGKGGMGAVFGVLSNGQPLGLKLVHKHLATEATTQLFFREAY